MRLALALLFLTGGLFASAQSEVTARSPLHNTFARLRAGQPIKVVAIGNSVTAGAPDGRNDKPSFYVALERWFETRFPEAEVAVVPRIIYAIGPEVQLFYQDSRLFPEAPDLVLAEFGAANGAWGRAGASVTEPATEGYIRRLRERLPETDLVLMLGMFRTLLDDYRAGVEPPSAAFIHRNASHYDALAVDAGREVARRVLAGEDWSIYMDDVIHPSARGYALYSELLVAALEREWQRFHAAPSGGIRAHELPSATLHPAPWSGPRLVSATSATTDGFAPEKNGALDFLRSTRADASGRYAAPPGREIVGVLMRESRPCGNLELRLADGTWLRLTQSATPHFTVKEDKANKLYRNFFAPAGLAGPLREIEFRVSPEPETPDARVVEIVGFFEIASPALPSP